MNSSSGPWIAEPASALLHLLRIGQDRGTGYLGPCWEWISEFAAQCHFRPLFQRLGHARGREEGRRGWGDVKIVVLFLLGAGERGRGRVSRILWGGGTRSEGEGVGDWRNSRGC